MAHVLIAQYKGLSGQRHVLPHTCSGPAEQCAEEFRAELATAIGADSNAEPGTPSEPQTVVGTERIHTWWIDCTYFALIDVFTESADGIAAHSEMVEAVLSELPWS